MNTPPNEGNPKAKAHEARHGNPSMFPGMFLVPGSGPDENKRFQLQDLFKQAGRDFCFKVFQKLEHFSAWHFQDQSQLSGGLSPIRLVDGSYLSRHAGHSQWSIEKDGHPLAGGTGIPALAAYLFGVPEDVAFVRMMESVFGHAFDAEARALFRSAYRDWIAAGRPERPAP